MKRSRKYFLHIAIATALVVLLLATSRLAQDAIASPDTYHDIDKIPSNNVGLLLGTTKKLKDGRGNLFYIYRIEAAVELYKAGKIKYILVSGDNSKESYDEPSDMMDSLIEKGVKPEDIVLDYAGFRTLDSVVRANKIFGVESMTIISQRFHTTRALTICYLEGIECLAYPAQDVPISRGPRVLLREILARVKTFIDYAIGKNPHFLGEEESVPWKK